MADPITLLAGGLAGGLSALLGTGAKAPNISMPTAAPPVQSPTGTPTTNAPQTQAPSFLAAAAGPQANQVTGNKSLLGQ
jgi:hypothetical protein